MTTPEKTTEKAAEKPVEGTNPPEGSTGTPKPSETGTDEPGTFPAAYVKELRDEAAKSRVGAKRAEALAQQAVTAYVEVTGKLADPSDLPFSEELLNEDGLPDRSKIVAAVDDLLTRKPHLASTRPVGDVGQGARGDGAPMVSLSEMLRAGAG